ncbi:hypothetical protein CQW23_31178 [Capsicum baccatum]|uniref:Knottin scorpion toxin-like domain-containing protein n=1 Tax=Capsicum baccatum TaxID=33114 RepID=A0A2G2V8B2_CAPBA|nr:hypothetical protein CQW23_31178 [Capsicum baccatum]PHU10917.1 hypothetical protein BC332_17847 [Capsicum chinense]
MARSIHFMAFLVLAMTLFVAYGVQGVEICCKPPTRALICSTDPFCKRFCNLDGYEDGHCFTDLSTCVCMKKCDVVQHSKTLAAELVEEEFLKQ